MIPARGARTALETGIDDDGYRISGCPGRNLHGPAYTPAGNPRHGYRRRQNLTVA